MHSHSNPNCALTEQDENAIARLLAALPAAAPERPATHACATIAYARVSKSVQDSIEDQLGAIRKDAERHGVPVARERFDHGMQRWNNKRPDYLALKEDILSGEYSHLWLFKADRLGGDDREFIGTVRLALHRGMTVRDTVIGEINENNVSMLGFLSHMEIKAYSDRVLMRLEAKAEDGIKIGAVPIGYVPQCTQNPCRCGRHGHPLPDPALVPLIQELFRGCAAGLSLGRIRAQFNAATGLRKSAHALKLVLRNPYYAGWVVNGKTRESIVLCEDGRPYGRPKEEWIVRRHGHPIIDQETFDAVQSRLDGATRKGHNRVRHPSHPLVGLVRCVRCKRSMRTNKSRSNRGWQCPVCLMGRGAKRFDDTVRRVLADVPFPTDAAAARYAERAEKQRLGLTEELQAIEAALDTITRKRSVWADMVAGDPPEMTREDYRAKVAETERERGELRQRREAVSSRLASMPSSGAASADVLAALHAMDNWTDTLDGMDTDQQRNVYRTLLDGLLIDPDAGTLTVRFTEDLAAWYGRREVVVPCRSQMPLPSQKARVNTN